MKTERKRIATCFSQWLGGSDYKYYKIMDEQDRLEAVKDERTGQDMIRRVNKERTEPIKVVEITSEEFHRIKGGKNNGENQQG